MSKRALIVLSLFACAALLPASALADRDGKGHRDRMVQVSRDDHRHDGHRGADSRGRHEGWERHRHGDRRAFAPATRVVHRPAPVTYVVVRPEPCREKVVYVAPRPVAPVWSISLTW